MHAVHVADTFSAKSMLEEMQKNGPPKAGLHGPTAKTAIELIVQGANYEFEKLDHELRISLSFITRKIAEKFLLDKNLIFRARNELDPNNSNESSNFYKQLNQAGKDLAELLIKNTPELFGMGLNAVLIGNAATKLSFTETIKIFSDPIFIKDGQISHSRVASVLNASDPRSLYLRVSETYKESALVNLGFAARLVLVRNPELSKARIGQAKSQMTAGLQKGISAEYTIASLEQKAWFDKYKDLPGYKDSHSVLIRLAKKDSNFRERALTEVAELVCLGSSHRNAINLILKENYYPQIQTALRLALENQLLSTAANNFAQSETGINSPNLGISKIKALKSLPLDWSDEMIVRVAVNDTSYKRKPGCRQIQEKVDLIEALKSNVEAKFRIDRSNPLQFEARRLLSRLTHEEIIQFYGVFFNSRTFPALNDTLLYAAELEGTNFRATVNGGKSSLLAAGLEAGKSSDPKFKTLCSKLSDFLISINPAVRNEIKDYFYRWLIDHAKKYYPRYIEISPEVVALVAETTIRNFDPKSIAKNINPESDLFKAFSGNIKHFYAYLIKHSLSESPLATRAYKCFIDLKISMQKEKRAIDNDKVWTELKIIRPDLLAGITEAQVEYERVRKLQSKSY